MEQRGFTLVETLIVVVLIGLVTAIALPSIRSGTAKRSLRGSRNTLVGLYGQARMTALQQGRTGQLRFDGNKALVTAVPGTGANAYDTIGVVRDLNAEFGVVVASDESPIPITPKGLVLVDGDVKVKVTKSGYADRMIISRDGRLRK